MDILKGKFFVGGKSGQQGMVLDVGGEWAFVQLFEWMMGEPSCCKLMSLDELSTFEFYDTQEKWKAAGEAQMPPRGRND